MPRKAIIGGSGFYDVKGLENVETRWVATEYGDVRVHIYDDLTGEGLAFIPRHGVEHAMPPHRINYRANVMALKLIGVERIIGVASVGSLREGLLPGDFVLVDQFIDFTRSRPGTFFEGPGNVVHADMTEPFCAEMRACMAAVPVAGTRIVGQGTYVCAEGPRFETAAEIRMYAALGGDVVGMTMVPEVVLARELGLCYAGLAVVTNQAAGIADVFSHKDVLKAMKQRESVLVKYVIDSLDTVPKERKCTCSQAPGQME